MQKAVEIMERNGRPNAGLSRARESTPPGGPLHPALQLQQQAGNQAVQDLLRSRFIQTKLEISNPSDSEEREADRVAEHIMRAPANSSAETPCPCMQSGGEPCEECKQNEGLIRRRAAGSAAAAVIPKTISNVLRSPGRSLDPATRNFFEPRFGRDFSQVRIHTDASAAYSAKAIRALAYTSGNHIVFAPGEYTPHAPSSQILMAHELAHVVQQSRRNLPDKVQRQTDTDAGSDAGLTPPTPDVESVSSTEAPATTAAISPEVARQLAYAATVLRRIPQLTDVAQERLDEIIGDTPIYQLIQDRNSKRARIEQDKLWLEDYEARNAAAMRGEELAGGVPASQDVLDQTANEIATLTPQVDQLDEQIQANLSALHISNEEELLRIVEHEFPKTWIERAKQIAGGMLDENKDLVQREKNRYAANICSPDIENLRGVDRHLKQLSDEVENQLSQVEMIEGAREQEVLPGGVSEQELSSSHYDIQRLPEMRAELERRRNLLRTERQNYGAKFKVLLLDDYSPGVFAEASDEQLTELTGTWLQTILDNIETTRENINQEKIKVWNLRDVARLTYQSLGVEENSVLGASVNRYIQGQVSDERALQLALTVLQIGAVLVATAVGGPLAGAIVGGALTLTQLMQDVDRYMAESAASRVALDPTIANISTNEPELLPIVFDVISLGLDAGPVVSELRAAARTMLATGQIGEYASAARRVAPEAADQLISRAERRLASGVKTAEQSPEAATAASQAEREIIASTANKSGADLTARELETEVSLVQRDPRRAIAEGEYVEEVVLENGHTWRRTKDGHWCRFSDPFCIVFGEGPTGAGVHIEEFPSQRLPLRGEWSGTPGNSNFTPSDPDVLRITNYQPIPYRDGRPNFSRWSVERGVILARGEFGAASRAEHNAAADAILAGRRGWRLPNNQPDVARATAFRSANDLTWHHVPGEPGVTLELVPRRLHEWAQHEGGFAELQGAWGP